MSIKALTVLCGVCLASLCIGQTDAQDWIPYESWTFLNFPDPQIEFARCGRQGPSNICDPNRLLPESEADDIDGILRRLFNETRVNYDAKGSLNGYVVMLAIMQKLDMSHAPPGATESYAYRFNQARTFAYIVQKYKWKAYHPNVLIFYSLEDNLLYTSTLHEARTKLSDNEVMSVTMEILANYPPAWQLNTIPQALKHLVLKYDEVLRAN